MELLYTTGQQWPNTLPLTYLPWTWEKHAHAAFCFQTQCLFLARCWACGLRCVCIDRTVNPPYDLQQFTSLHLPPCGFVSSVPIWWSDCFNSCCRHPPLFCLEHSSHPSPATISISVYINILEGFTLGSWVDYDSTRPTRPRVHILSGKWFPKGKLKRRSASTHLSDLFLLSSVQTNW